MNVVLLLLLFTSPLQAGNKFVSCEAFTRFVGESHRLKELVFPNPSDFPFERVLADILLSIEAGEPRDRFKDEVESLYRRVKVKVIDSDSRVGLFKVKLPLFSRFPLLEWHRPVLGLESSVVNEKHSFIGPHSDRRMALVREMLEAVRVVVEMHALLEYEWANAWTPWREPKGSTIDFLHLVQKQLFFQFHVVSGLSHSDESLAGIATLLPDQPEPITYSRPEGTTIFSKMVLSKELFNLLERLPRQDPPGYPTGLFWVAQWDCIRAYMDKCIKNP